MSRIQSILDKAEREGAMLRTGRFDAPAPLTATVPITIDLDAPEPADSRPERSIAPAAPSPMGHGTVASGSAVLPSTDAIASHFVRLSPLLVAGLAPKSAAAEQYRQLRTRLAHAEGMNNLRTVLVTSPQKGEGKSLTSANLALTMAQELHRKVAIVEADLRKPSMLQLFGLPPGPGLTEYLSGAVDAKDIMRFLPDHNLTVIPAGSAATSPAELLGSTAMRRLLDALRIRFDRVILDTPPVLPLADVAVLAPLVDGSLMVVRAGVTPKPAIENALRAFDSSRLLGIVLNDSGAEHDYRYEATRQ
jgi:capsular exopolysaccharide synthesis family protein